MDRRLFITTIAGFSIGLITCGISCASKEEEKNDSAKGKDKATEELSDKKMDAASGAVTKAIRGENISGAVTKTNSASGAVTTAK